MKDSTNLQQLLTELVSFYPVTSNQENVLSLLNFVKEELADYGLSSDILTNNGIHMLYASTQDNKKPKVLLQAHVDVVPAESQQRTAIKDGAKLYGRGTRDMLFAVAGYIKFVHDNCKILKKFDVGILLTGDEEIGGENTVPYLLAQGYQADVVWLPDAGNKLDELVMSAKGVYNFDILVKGTAHHGSRPWEGDNATGKLIKLLHELTNTFAEPSNEATTCTITQLEAGDSVNKGPAKARAHIDIRYTSKSELLKYNEIVRRLCKKYNAETHNVFTEPNYKVNTNHELIKTYMAVNKAVTGSKPTLITVSGSSDARYFSEKKMPVIMTRPTSEGSHSDEEWLDLESFEQYYKIMQQYLLEVATIGTL